MSSLEMSSSDSSQQSTSSKLAENSAFREAENEVISIVTKMNNNPIKSDDGHPDLSKIPFLSTYQSECLTTRDNLLQVCAQTKTCQNIKPAIDGMCRIRYFGHDDPLQDMSIRAAEQMICIVAVCLLCSGLYLIMCWLEKICTTFFSNPEEKEENQK